LPERPALRRFVVALAVASGVAPSIRAQNLRFPPRLDQYLKSHARLTDAEWASLAGGAPVTKLLDADPATEVAVFGAVWVAARIQDFAELDLPDDDPPGRTSLKGK